MTRFRHWALWALLGVAASIVNPCPSSAQNQVFDGAERSFAVFGGVITDNDWQETLVPWRIELLDSYLTGVALGYDWRLPNERWSLGFELQAVRHFGEQSHFEFNLPVVLRYRPSDPWIPALESVAFGIGPSYATEIPRVEVLRDGASRKVLVYWMGELEFGTRRDDTSVFLRLHHRSDAYGLLSPPAGSNTITIGMRQDF